MKKIIFFALSIFGGVSALFIGASAVSAASNIGDTYVLNSGTWTIPSDVSEVRIEVWGGGGGGGNGVKTHNHNISGFGGGGGGYAAKTAAVKPGDTYTITVGQGGKGYRTGGPAYGGGRSSFIGGSITLTAGGGGAGMSGVDSSDNSGTRGGDGEGPLGGPGGDNYTYIQDATTINRWDIAHPSGHVQLNYRGESNFLADAWRGIESFFSPTPVYAVLSTTPDTGGAPSFSASYGGVMGQGGKGMGGDTNLAGSDGGPYARSADGSNPYASNGGSAPNGGNGGSRGRLGRDGQGCCQASDTWAQDGGFPGGGGGGSDTGTGGYGADGKVLVTVTAVKSAVCTDPSANNFNKSGDCLYTPTIAFAASVKSALPLQSFDLSWSSQNADSCKSSGDWSIPDPMPLSGTDSERLILSDKTFTVTCTGAGGEATKSVTVSLFSAPGPTISWSPSNPTTAACNAQYTISATGADQSGTLAKVSIDKNGTPFAYAGGGNGDTNTTGNPTSDTGPQTVTYTAWSENAAGTQSSKISMDVKVGACAGQPGCTDPQATNFDPNAKTDNGSCTYAQPTASLSVSSTCVAPNSNITFTTNATGRSISSYTIQKDSNQDGIFGTLKDFGATSGTETYTTTLGEGLYDFKTQVVASNGTVSSPVTRVTVSPTCSPSLVCSLMPSLCPAPVITAPDFSTYTWYSDDPNSWPTLSTPSSLTADQSMRAKLLSGEQFYNKNLGVNSGKITSSPAPQSTQMQLYVFDYAKGQIVATRTVNVGISTNPNNNNNNTNSGGTGGGRQCSVSSQSAFGGGMVSLQWTVGGGGTFSWNMPGSTQCFTNANNKNSIPQGASGSEALATVPNGSFYTVGCSAANGFPSGSGSVTATVNDTNCTPLVQKCTDPNASNNGQTGTCVYPSFTISLDPSIVKAKSLAGYSGSFEKEVHISVNPVSGFTAPVSIAVDPSSLATPAKPEFSFAGGQYSSTSPSGALSWDGSFFRSNGLIYLPVKVRYTGVLPKGQSTIIFRATALPGGLGAGQTATASLIVDSNPLYPGYREQ